jgi:hypothetical protein
MTLENHKCMFSMNGYYNIELIELKIALFVVTDILCNNSSFTDQTFLCLNSRQLKIKKDHNIINLLQTKNTQH